MKNKRPNKKIEISETSRTAYHEAGHAVVHAALGRRFSKVELEDGTRTMNVSETHRLRFVGRTLFTEADDKEFLDRARRGLLDVGWLVAGPAGGIAESTFIGGMDAEIVHAIQVDLLGMDLVVGSALGPAAIEGPVKKHLFLGATEEAMALVATHWSAVEAVARRLMKDRSLSYDEVKEIVDEEAKKRRRVKSPKKRGK